MKYYIIESVTKKKATGEVVALGSSKVKVDSEDDVKAIIQEMIESNKTSEYIEDDIKYHEM